MSILTSSQGIPRTLESGRDMYEVYEADTNSCKFQSSSFLKLGIEAFATPISLSRRFRLCCHRIMNELGLPSSYPFHTKSSYPHTNFLAANGMWYDTTITFNGKTMTTSLANGEWGDGKNNIKWDGIICLCNKKGLQPRLKSFQNHIRYASKS